MTGAIQFSFGRTILGAIGGLILCIVAAFVAGLRECGPSLAGEAPVVALLGPIFYWKGALAVVIISAVFGGLIKMRGSVILLTFLLVALAMIGAAWLLVPPLEGGCTPI
ncbi:MAG TPA: hypothetical protein VMV82_01225 [Candidatus Dormibacteraeota bacterium]|nr:hypothetical protein [Candidatus Dormibacteraeota bacterium]